MPAYFQKSSLVSLLLLILLATPFSALQSAARAAQTGVQLSKLTTLERGGLTKPVWSPDGKTLAVIGELGIWLFDRDHLHATPRLLPELRRIVAFSPDNSHAASLSTTGDILLWDVQSGKTLRTFYSIKDRLIWINDLAFSPDGTQLVMAYGGGGNMAPTGGITVWEVATSREIVSLCGFLNDPLCLAFTPDGRFLAAGSYGRAALWDTTMWAITELPATIAGRLFDISVNTDGTKLAFYSGYGGISIVDLATLQVVMEGTTSPIDLAFSPLQTTILAMATYQQVIVRDLTRNQIIAELPAARTITFSPDGTLLAAVNGATLSLYDTLTYQLRDTVGGFNDRVGQLRFTDDSAWLIYERAQNMFGIWNTQNLTSPILLSRLGWQPAIKPFLPKFIEYQATYDEFTGKYSLLQFTARPSPRPDINVVAPNAGCYSYASGELTVKLQDTATGKTLHTLAGHQYPVCFSVFSPDGRTLVTADNDNLSYTSNNPNANHAVFVWDVDTGKRIAQLLDHAGSIGMNQVIFSPDGSRLALVHTLAVEIWDTANWHQLSHISIFPQGYMQALFIHSGNIVITRNTWGKVQFWESTSGTELASIDNESSDMLLSPDDNLLALPTSYGTIDIWRISDFQY